ncbi:DnaJ C-terminal domain-containing protein [Candidatus Phytoplasma sp. AldY-WA1]|uniref:DnaJ C-terminal domain-containing protein n=1 Tax=Candidatus Phytoplasma sp. AldY-WA1 TaxID=2852100 RepID=UPI00254F2E12|nr:DnaJ C-terminal domain-containing protein [Candidatus Phytoplasma sp. AldY-WA1]
MKSKRDYYDVLEVSKNASDTEIKKSYHRLVKKYHPDVSKEDNAATKFKEVQEAYQVLRNAKKRSDYDRVWHQDYSNFNNSGFQGFNQGFSSGENRTNKQKNTNNVKDKYVECVIDFLEACLGGKKEIKVDFEEDCKQCHGTGVPNKTDVKICNYCNGTGHITKYQRFFFKKYQVCSYCRGTGRIIAKKCSFCKSSKRVLNVKTISIDIPAGVEDGMTMKLDQQGHGGHLNSKNSDLYITFKIRPHEIFEREKQNIISTVWINFYDAILGKELSIPTIYGEVELKIPEGTQTHTKFKLKNKGIPYLHSNFRKGDHFVIVKIKTPTKNNYNNHNNKSSELHLDKIIQKIVKGPLKNINIEFSNKNTLIDIYNEDKNIIILNGFLLSKILNEYNFRIYFLYLNIKSNLNLQQRVLYLKKEELKTIDLDFRISVNKPTHYDLIKKLLFININITTNTDFIDRSYFID